MSPLLTETSQKLLDAKQLVDQLRTLISKWQTIERKAIALDARIQILEDQLEQFSELAGLGLTAEALSHEIHTIADGLAERTKKVTDQLRKKQISNGDLVAYTENVHSAISGLRKQLSHLAPSLRYVREQKDEISMLKFFQDMRSFYMNGRFKRSKIQFVFAEPFDDFVIRINRGKLTQVIDNLILNSEYWLQDNVSKKEIKNPRIVVKSKSPFIYISDNGMGIEPSIVASLFQPFVTMKPKGVGRGLGLFIVRELLDSSGCSIRLMPDKNKFDRRYIFQINFAGAFNDK